MIVNSNINLIKFALSLNPKVRQGIVNLHQDKAS